MAPENADEPAVAQSAEDTREVAVRPLNFVADEPVIRRIGNRDTFLGNRHAADPDRHDRRFDHVLSLTSEAHPLTTHHHHPLEDGPGNEWAAFEAAVDAARDLLRRDGSLLVHCTAGISRSTAVLATALAAEAGRPFADALEVVQRARPHAIPHPALHETAVVYLAARSLSVCRGGPTQLSDRSK